MTDMRVAIIGTGPSGMAQLRAFATAQAAGHAVPEIVAFERQSDWGGQWNYSWLTGLDEHGEPVHSSMYRNLWSNAPKEALEFADYTFDEHFGRPISSYPPRAVLWDYISGRLDQHDLRQHVRFNTAVRWVVPDEQGFTVESEHLPTGETRSERFDRIIVANGHFSTPNTPEFSGIESFAGEILHAHDFRGAERFQDRRVLLIGSSYSAEDIGVQAHKLGAAHVVLSYRTAPINAPWPAGIEERPLVERFAGKRAFFADGSHADFDVIVFCTGYQHHTPFLPRSLSLTGPNTVYPEGLYRGVLWQDDPRVAYVGAQDQWFTFNMFDAQAWFVRDTFMGRLSLPSREHRAADILRWRERFLAIDSEESEIRFQSDYIRDLIDATDYPSFDLRQVEQIFRGWQLSKRENVLDYRDLTYRSVMTGTMARPHHTPWMSESDDSLERYLGPGDREPTVTLTPSQQHLSKPGAQFDPVEVVGAVEAAARG